MSVVFFSCMHMSKAVLQVVLRSHQSLPCVWWACNKTTSITSAVWLLSICNCNKLQISKHITYDYLISQCWNENQEQTNGNSNKRMPPYAASVSDKSIKCHQKRHYTDTYIQTLHTKSIYVWTSARPTYVL